MNKNATVLIIDDDYDYVETTRCLLEKNDYRVEAVYSRTAAIQKISDIMPDVILLDIMMERMNDGFKLCYDLKHDPRFRAIPVIAVSSVNRISGFNFSPDTDGEYFEADEFLEKPVDHKALLRAIEALLDPDTAHT